jgi:hypothetical protein
MSDRPLPTNGRVARSSYDPILIVIVVVGAIALLFLISAFMLRGEKRVDMNQAQPNIETPTTGETQKP